MCGIATVFRSNPLQVLAPRTHAHVHPGHSNLLLVCNHLAYLGLRRFHQPAVARCKSTLSLLARHTAEARLCDSCPGQGYCVTAVRGSYNATAQMVSKYATVHALSDTCITLQEVAGVTAGGGRARGCMTAHWGRSGGAGRAHSERVSSTHFRGRVAQGKWKAGPGGVTSGDWEAR